MRPYSLDDYWELVKIRYETRRQPLPRRWRLLYRLVRAILRWGAS